MIDDYLKLLLEKEEEPDENIEESEPNIENDNGDVDNEKSTEKEFDETDLDVDASSGEDYDVGDPDDPMSGMSGEDPGYEPKTPEDIGKVYELKKIYYRLTAIQDYLSDFSDDKLYKVRSYISEALELFLLISKNMLIFKEELDNVIILFYKFLKIVYMVIHKYVEEMEDENTEDAQMLDKIKSIKKSTLDKINKEKENKKTGVQKYVK